MLRELVRKEMLNKRSTERPLPLKSHHLLKKVKMNRALNEPPKSHPDERLLHALLIN